MADSQNRHFVFLRPWFFLDSSFYGRPIGQV
jgi:hypothetical protein